MAYLVSISQEQNDEIFIPATNITTKEGAYILMVLLEAVIYLRLKW